MNDWDSWGREITRTNPIIRRLRERTLRTDPEHTTQRVMAALQRRGQTLREIGEAFGMDRLEVYQIITGRRTPLQKGSSA